MNTQQIFEKLKTEFEDAIIEIGGEAPSDQWIQVDPEKIVDICLYLRDSGTLLFDYMVNLSGMDYTENFGVVYHLYSVKYGFRTVLKVTLDKENPKVPTVERVWKTANWHEREAYDMFGIDFEGHPNLIRILCCYDWEGFPLRKDYKVQEEYHGIKIPY